MVEETVPQPVNVTFRKQVNLVDAISCVVPREVRVIYLVKLLHAVRVERFAFVRS